MFMEFGFREGGSEAEAFREGFALADAAEAWGLDSAWLSEFHFTPDRSVLSSPIVTAGALAARTKRMRIGIAVYVLPLANPLRVAEEVATLDQISGGRFEFGIGRSGFVNSYNSYAIPYAESQERFDEALAILRQAWRGERFSHEGRHYRVDGATVVPQPVQRPHPPMRMAATSAQTFEKVAAEGLPIFVGLRGDDLSVLADSLARYRRAWRQAGHDGEASAYLRVPVYVAETEAAALDEPRACISYYFERQARLVAEQGVERPSGNAPREKMAEGLAALGYDEILASRVAFGTPGQVVDRLSHWQDALGIDGIVMELNAGGLLSEAQVLNSLRLITAEVMPAFK
ncbi:MAG: LLM class flavin-dependent oxidoreductase [Alphaproteobacteria bacterium]|nr:LLM class flavin-dependent oxidoreductase [Alphaproteobacteria bacterium]